MSILVDEEQVFGAPPPRDSDLASVTRALRVLQIVGAYNDGGIRFSDLTKTTGLSNATLHRLLQTLIHEGFVEQCALTRHYNLGFRFLSLGTQAANRYNIRDMAHDGLRRLAKNTEDTVFLSVPSYYDCVVVDRIEGTYPIKALAATVGSRRPLGVGSGALALLAFMPKQRREKAILRNAERADEFPQLKPEIVTRAVEETRAKGYAMAGEAILKGMTSISVVIPGPKKQPLAAISVAAIVERLAARRRELILSELQREVARISVVTNG